MAVHWQPAEAGDRAAFVGPRFSTVVQVPVPVSDLDPSEAFRNALRQLSQGVPWRVVRHSIDEWYDRWSQAAREHVWKQYEAEAQGKLAEWITAYVRDREAARSEAGDTDPDPAEGLRLVELERVAAACLDAKGVNFDPADTVWPGIDSPSRPALAGVEEHNRWWEAGARIVRGQNPASLPEGV